ncbi:hypothetical protein ACWF94_39950 [Streptomyces sp. NPDC055078]
MTYHLPGPRELVNAIDTAQARLAAADAHRARVACTVIAAAVRDILTDFDHDAEFDATGLALLVGEHRGAVIPRGTYWTASDEVRHIEDPHAQDGLSEWVSHLNGDNRAGWEPLCTVLSRGYYRLDLARAAQLPHDRDTASADLEIAADDGTRVAEISVEFQTSENGHEPLSVPAGVRAAEVLARAPEHLARLAALVSQARDLIARDH